MSFFNNLVAGASDPRWGGVIDAAGNMAGLYSAVQQNKTAGDIRKNADPFAKYRPQYGAQLAKIMADPSAFENDPAYKFIRDQGLEAVTRQMAAGGFNNSGNMAMELAKYGSGLAATYRGQEVDRLSGLAGATITPSPRSTAVGAQNSAFEQLGDILANVGYGRTRNAGEAGVNTVLDMAKGGTIPYAMHAAGQVMQAGGGAAGALSTLLSGGNIGPGTALEMALSGTGAANAAGGAAVTAAGSGATGGGLMSGVLAAAPWVAGALALGAVVAKAEPDSSPLNGFKYDATTGGGWDKPQNFDKTKFTAQELNEFFGPAIKVFNETGNIEQALAAIPQPQNARQEIMLKGGVKALFGGTGNPFRVIAAKKGFGRGAWTASSPEKKALMDSLNV